MKQLINLSIILLVFSALTTTFAQDENQNNFQKRKMVKAQSLQGTNIQGSNWVDADGDGICDSFTANSRSQGKGYGLKDGSKAGVRPQDGSGFGKGSVNSSGSGVCDETGSKGSANRKGRK